MKLFCNLSISVSNKLKIVCLRNLSGVPNPSPILKLQKMQKSNQYKGTPHTPQATTIAFFWGPTFLQAPSLPTQKKTISCFAQKHSLFNWWPTCLKAYPLTWWPACLKAFPFQLVAQHRTQSQLKPLKFENHPQP